MANPDHSCFRFEKRPRCACGAALTESGPVVRRRTAWGEVTFRRCGACGSFAQSPQLDRASLAAWHDSEDYRGGAGRPGAGYLNYAADDTARKREAEGRCRRDILPSIEVGARVLEIGCADGALLAALRDHGCSVRGIDLSQKFAAMARDVNGIDVTVGDFADVPFEDDGFDAILLLGSLSNLRDLPSQLAKMHRLLAPGGLLFLNCPVADSMVARLYGGNHWMFVPSVNAFLTREGCIGALANAGFEVERMRRDFQQPSLRKIVGHARLGNFLGRLASAPIGGWSPPMAFPVPGVYAVWGRKKR